MPIGNKKQSICDVDDKGNLSNCKDIIWDLASILTNRGSVPEPVNKILTKLQSFNLLEDEIAGLFVCCCCLGDWSVDDRSGELFSYLKIALKWLLFEKMESDNKNFVERLCDKVNKCKSFDDYQTNINFLNEFFYKQAHILGCLYSIFFHILVYNLGVFHAIHPYIQGYFL